MFTEEQVKKLDWEFDESEFCFLPHVKNLANLLYKMVDGTYENHSLERAEEMLTLIELLNNYVQGMHTGYNKYFELLKNMNNQKVVDVISEKIAS